jgi:hypothetical protein
MRQSIGAVTLLVRDYREAIEFFTVCLRFRVLGDAPAGEGRRGALLAARGAAECHVLLAKAKNEETLASLGRQAGGGVFPFLHTDDFPGDHRECCGAASGSARSRRSRPTAPWPSSRTFTGTGGTSSCLGRLVGDKCRWMS